MKKDLLLVLCFYEGQGFVPKEHHSVVLSAKIDNNILSTDPIPQTCEPKFCTEVSWTVDHQTLRRYKLSRVPVRVECFSIDKHDAKHHLGYIILTLSSVVQGIETDPKWHKLLGGSLQQSKVPPQLLLSLNLYPVKPDAKVTPDSPKMLHNGNIHGGQYAMSSVPNSAVNNHLTQQNGTSNVYQDANMNSHLPQAYQDVLQAAGFGATSKLGALFPDRSQVLISSSQKDIYQAPSHVENQGNMESGSSRGLNNEQSQALAIDLEDEDNSNDIFKIDDVYTEKMEEVHHHQDDFQSMPKKKVASRFDAVLSETVKENNFTKCNGQVEFKEKTKSHATSPLDRARSLLDGITNGGDRKRELSAKSKENVIIDDDDDDDDDIYAGLEDEDEGLDSGFQSKVGGKMGEAWLPPQPSAYASSGECEQGAVGFSRDSHSVSQSKTEKRRLSDPLSDAVVGKKQNYIPVKNRELQSGNIHSSGGRQSSGNSDQLVPRMNHEGGFIQIGPVGDPQEESFEFSVTIVFAKNLDQLLPKDFTWSPNSGTCFSYSLMGCRITSDPIRSLHNPEFLAERVAGNIRSTASNLSTYFKKNSNFPIHFLIGDLCLASTSISLSKFHEFDSKLIAQMPLTIEGMHHLVSVVPDGRDIIPGKEPVIGIVIQLCSQLDKTSHHIPFDLSNSDCNDSEFELYSYTPRRRRKSRTSKLRNLSKFGIASSSSSSSESSEDEIMPAGKKRRGVTPRNLHHKEKSLLSELYALRELSDEGNKLRRHLFKAAMEVESWKEDQQALFLKQWSAREAELQRHLSDEWRTRINSIEASLHSRLAQSDALNRKLTSALSELSIREKKLSIKEERVRKLLEDLELQKSEQEAAENETFEGRLKQKERIENDTLLEELKQEKEKREELEDEVCDLKTTLEQLQMPPHHQYYEMKKQITSLKGQKEMLTGELSSALKKKQYYKAQWVRSVNDFHHLKKSHMKEMEYLRYEMEMSSPEPLYVHPHNYKRNRIRSHTVDGSDRRSKVTSSGRRSGKGSESFLPVKKPSVDEHGFRGSLNMDAGCSWMDQPSSRDAHSHKEQRLSGGITRGRIESERTLMDTGKITRASFGNPSDYEEMMRQRSNEEQFEKLLKNVWKGGEK